MKKFIFKSYNFNESDSTVKFEYGFDDGRDFIEIIKFKSGNNYNKEVLEKALFLAFVLIGVSYYKTFPSVDVELSVPIDNWQSDFFNKVYQEGLGQFAFENGLKRHDLVHFIASDQSNNQPAPYHGAGVLALQSGGKDSILTASLLQKNNIDFTSFYISSSDFYPSVLDEIGSELVVIRRVIDRDGLISASKDGAKNGHVPITYIVQSLAVIQAILMNKHQILTSIAHEGEESHANIDDLSVTHQWSKTWMAEQLFSDYVSKYISLDLHIGSPLRHYSELRVAELFVKYSWEKYHNIFSSCNVANYQQGSDNSTLKWCGNCPKCANSYLLFAPFLPANSLKAIFDGQDLFAKPSLAHTFKGLLGIDNVPKPFECIGEIDELRLAYHRSQSKGDYQSLPFDVPESEFDYMKTYPAQEWAVRMLQ